MYALINAHVEIILNSIDDNHVPQYDWLVANLNAGGAPEFQRRYKNFWRMNVIRPSPNYSAAYFALLNDQEQQHRNITELTNTLYQTPTNANGNSVQFTFATKLCHMFNRHSPIYDSMVADFFFFQEPNKKEPLPARIENLVRFHAFLTTEYERILQNNLLDQALEAFRQKFTPQSFTNEKIVDSLIWSYTSLLKRGALPARQVLYS